MRTKEEIERNALAVFESHPDAKVLHCTSDGELFFEKEHAALHASQHGLTVEVINRKVGKAAVDTQTLTSN